MCSKSISADIKTDKVPIDQHLLANTDAGLRLASGRVIIIMSQQAGAENFIQVCRPNVPVEEMRRQQEPQK